MKKYIIITLVTIAVLAFSCNQKKENNKKNIPDFSMVDRKDVPEEYKWKIDDIYPSLEAWKKEKDELIKMIAKIDVSSKDWTSNAKKMLGFLNLKNEIDLKNYKIYFYISKQIDTDMGNSQFQALEGEVNNISVEINTKLAFVNNDILKLGKEKFAKYLKDEPELEQYRFNIEKILSLKEHILPTEQQIIVAKTGLFSNVTSQAANLINDVEMPMPKIKLNSGEEIELNYSNYIKYRASENANDRTLVMTTFWNNHKKFENTLATLQDGEIKKNFYYSSITKYKSCLEASLFYNNIDTNVYLQLIKAVHENLPILHRYLKLKKEMLGIEKMRYEDLFSNSVKNTSSLYTYEEAKDLLLEAFKPLGEEYVAYVKKSFDDKWLDIYPNKGKESGAYSSGLYGVHPYIKLNYNGTYESVSTTAHELGHAMHYYLSSKNQNFDNVQYPTFLAEIASSFNENLFMDYMIKNNNDDLFKLFILENYLDDVRGSIFRQTLFAEFELEMYRRVENGQSLTPDWLNSRYLELTRLYYGHDKGIVEVNDYIQCEWSNISHFYLNFYVYQYSTGSIAAMALSDQVLNGSKEEQVKYLNMLKSGGSDYPLNILKRTGIDMTTPTPTVKAMKNIENLISIMETIYKRNRKEGKL